MQVVPPPSADAGASERRGAAGPARAGSASGCHGSAGSDPVRRAGRVRQDDDPGRPAGVADRFGSGAGGRDPRHHLQPARRGGADRTGRGGTGAARARSGCGPDPDVPRPRAGDPPGRRRARRAVARPAGDPAADRPRDGGRGLASSRHGVLATEARPRRDGRRGGDRPGAGPDRTGLPRLRGRARRGGRPRLRRSRRARPPVASSAMPVSWRAGGHARPSCSSTRPRTSTAPSSGSRCCSPRRRTGSSWSATTTSRSTAGGSPTSDACWAWPTPCPACVASTSW